MQVIQKKKIERRAKQGPRAKNIRSLASTLFIKIFVLSFSGILLKNTNIRYMQMKVYCTAPYSPVCYTWFDDFSG